MVQEFKNYSNKTKNSVISNTSDERYKTLFEHINAAVFLTTLNGEIIEANQRSCDFFGYRLNELLCLSLKNFFPQNFNWKQFIEDISACGGSNIETLAVCKDGGNLPVELSVSLFKIDEKAVMFVLIWDISERKASEERLKESEKKYHGLFQYSTDGILMLDARGEIKDVNTKLCEIIGCKKNEIIGNNLFNSEIFTYKSLPSVVYLFEQLLSDKKAQYYTAQIQNKNNELFDVEVSSFFLVKKDNEIDNFIIIIRDITDREIIDKNIVLENELLKSLMDNMTDSVYFKDEQNRFILVNDAKAILLKTSKDEIINKTDFNFLPEELAKKIVKDDDKIKQSGQSIINKIGKIKYFDGNEHWISETKVPRYNSEGEFIGLIGIEKDITEIKQMENELVNLQLSYEAIFENPAFAIIQVNENGKIQSWNKLTETLLNTNYDHLYGKKIMDLFSPEEWERIKTPFNENKEKIRNIKIKINKHNDQPLDVFLSITIKKDDCGKILGQTYILKT